jgi:transcription elongation factor GreB
MSKAFTREDVDPPERPRRKRSISGLPPGAVNYITQRGARRLKAELTKLHQTANDAERLAELKGILESVRIVNPPDTQSNSVGFGATVTLERTGGEIETYTIVGVDECDFEPNGVSWISALGKILLAAELGSRVILDDGGAAKVVKVEYQAE